MTLLAAGVSSPWQLFNFLFPLPYIFFISAYTVVIYIWISIVKSVSNFNINLTNIKITLFCISIAVYTLYIVSWFLVVDYFYFLSITGVIVAFSILFLIFGYIIYGVKLLKIVKKSPAIIQSPEKLQFLINIDFLVQLNVLVMYISVYTILGPIFLIFIFISSKFVVIGEFFWLCETIVYLLVLLYCFRPIKKITDSNMEMIHTFTATVTTTSVEMHTNSEISTNTE
jgi:hypothetical protein